MAAHWKGGPPASRRRPGAQSGLPDVYERGAPIVGDTYYMTTNLDAPNKKVVAIDLKDPAPAKWREVIPERKDAVLETLANAEGLLVARYIKNASNRIERFGLDGQSKGEIPLPGIGWTFIATQPDQTEAFLNFMSFNEPMTLYRIDLATGERWSGGGRRSLSIPPALRSSRSGTRPRTAPNQHVPHLQKGNEEGRLQPTTLYGYGGFGISMTPRFNPGTVAWIEAAMLLTAGEHDESVHPLHARKITALLQAATASAPEAEPILLQVDRDTGHGATDKYIQGAVDQPGFLMWQLKAGEACG